MTHRKFIVEEKQLTNAIESGIKEHITNNTIIRELMISIVYNVLTVLEDDCEEFNEDDWEYKGD